MTWFVTGALRNKLDSKKHTTITIPYAPATMAALGFGDRTVAVTRFSSATFFDNAGRVLLTRSNSMAIVGDVFAAEADAASRMNAV